MRVPSLLSVAMLIAMCRGQDIAQEVCQANRQIAEISSGTTNVLIGGLMQIREAGENGYGCGVPSPEYMQIFEAARYALNILNQDYLPGFNFGLKVYDTCGSQSQALSGLLNLYPQSRSSNPYCAKSSQAVTVGIIGATNSRISIPVADLAGRMPASVISPKSTSPMLSDKFKYPTFLRTTPSSTTIAKAMVEVLNTLQWQNMLVVYVEDDSSSAFYQELLKATNSKGLCVSRAIGVAPGSDVSQYRAILQDLGSTQFTAAVFLGSNQEARTMLQAAQQVASAGNIQWIFSDLDMTQDISSLTMARGALVVTLRSPLVTEFREYFVNLEQNPTSNTRNPWFEDWYEAVYGCSLNGAVNRCPTRTPTQIRDDFVQSPWVVPTMKAVFAYAEVVRAVCGGSGVCSALLNMSPSEFNNRLKTLNFNIPNNFPVPSLRGEIIRFDDNGDPMNADFTIYNYNNQGGGTFDFKEVGSYIAGVLTMSQNPTVYNAGRSTVITIPTASCATVGCDSCLLPQTTVAFHYTPGDLVIGSLVNAHGSSKAAFTCGEGIASRLSALVAAEWAVQKFKEQNPNKLNGVSMGSLVADVCPNSFVSNSFLTDLLSGNNRLVDAAGRVISPNTIKAFVDQTGNDQARNIHRILSKYEIPEIQIGASTSDLSGMKDAFFSRAVPNEDVFFTAIASLLQNLGWKYVQVATRMNGMYEEQTQLFRKLAARYGVCITGYVDFSANVSSVVSTLQANRGSVVVVIAGIEDLQNLMEEMGTRGINNLQLVSGVEEWSRDPDLVVDPAFANGLIMLESQLTSANSFNAFNTWLSGLTTSQITANTFLRELFEVTNKCSLTPSSQGLYGKSCGNADRFNIYQARAPYVIESVYLVADKLHEIIVEICQDSNYNGLCPEFIAASDIGARLEAKLRNARATSGFEIRDGEGLTDYRFYTYKQGQQYVQFGSFVTENLQLGALTLSQIPTYTQYQDTCSGVCVECQYLYSLQGRYFVPGDWLVAGTFSVSQSGEPHLQPYICGEIREINGPEYTTAMLYALHRINEGKAPVAVKGVDIGGLVMDHCNNEGRVDLMVSDVFSGQLGSMGVDQTRILSWLTDNTGSTKEAAQLLGPLGVAMVSPSATSASLMDYPTFHRTIQGDTTVATALIKVVKALGFPYIQVAHAASDYGQEGLKTVQAVAEAEGVCVTTVVEMDQTKVVDVVNSLVESETNVVILFMGTSDTRALMEAIAGHATASRSLLILMPEPYEEVIQSVAPRLSHPVISLRLQNSVLDDYKAYIDSSPIENPYFAQFYMKLQNCNLPGYSMYNRACTMPLAGITSSPNYKSDNFILATINAVYASVDALDRTIKEFCGTDYTEPCADFLSSPIQRQRYNVLLNSANFVDEGSNEFRFLEREGNVAYDILQSYTASTQGLYRNVGSYAGVSLDLAESVENDYTTIVSECPAPCLGCIMMGLNFSYTPGDIYLAGVFDVHQKSTSPFTCGGINTLHGFLLLEAFHFALDQVNDNKGPFANILHGTRLGGIGLDACDSQVRGGYLVSNINNGLTSLARDGAIVSPSEIDVYIGSYRSEASRYLARILTDLEVPQISFAASSSILNDTRIFPYFYRTVPSEKSEIEAMLKFMDKNNIRYVQILYEDSSNAELAKMIFEEMAADYKVCVAQTVVYPSVGEPDSESSNFVVAKLVDEPTANTVVTFLGTEYINSILAAVGRSDRAKNALRFFGDSAWADNQEAIEGAEAYAVDSLTVKLDADDVDTFETYIDSKTLANSGENPWFEEYYQRIHNCYTSKANTMGYPAPCSLSRQSTINAQGYQQDPGVVHVMNAVYAAAFAIHETLEDTCGENYATVCQAYKNNAARRQGISTHLEGVRFTDPVGNLFMFEDRQANANFRFYTLTEGRFSGANYEQIGLYDYSSSTVNMTTTYQSSWNSDCDRLDACTECPAIRDSDIRYHIYNRLAGQRPIPQDATTIVAFFDIHEQGVDPYRCGKLNMDGFHQFLAFLYSANDLFANYVNGVSDNQGLRLIAIDTCSNSLRVDQDLFGLLQGTGLCNTAFDSNGLTMNIGNIGSVLTMGNANTMAASRVLEGPGITYVSPNAMSTALDPNEFLARTISPVSGQMYALINLLKSLGWSYIDVLYEQSADGSQPWAKFNYLAGLEKICQGSVASLSPTSGNKEYDDALDALSGDLGSKAVLLMGSEAFIRRVMARASTQGVADDYVWLLATEWEFTPDQLAGLATQRLQIMTVRAVTDTVEDFNTYVSGLRYVPTSTTKNNALMPREWFEEFYQTAHDCTLSDAIKPINMDKPECQQGLSIPANAVNQNKYVINTLAAMKAITNGLGNYISTCAGSCNTGQPLNNRQAREAIRESILDVTWNLKDNVKLMDDSDLMLQFNAMRWWDTIYEVYMWNVNPGTVPLPVMVYRGMLNDPSGDDVKTMKAATNLTSQCSQGKPSACGCSFEEIGEAIALPSVGYQASNHRNYYRYDSDDKQQYDWPIWAIATGVVTTVGIVITLILFLILLFAYPKRGGTTVLGYMAILGIIGIYAINFAFFVHATDATCGIRRFLMGVVYMITFSALLIKAIDNWRFSHVEYAEERYSGISSPCALLSCALGIVLIQCIIPIIWLILVHPTATKVTLKDGGDILRHDNWWCDPPDDYDLGLVLSFVFVVFILVITAVFSALAFDTERNSYESRWTLFGCVATAGCFLVWMIVTTNAGPHYRDPAVAMANVVNATILMIVLPLRKSILMCRARQDSEDEKEAMEVINRNQYDNYGNFNNPAFELDYDNQYMDG